MFKFNISVKMSYSKVLTIAILSFALTIRLCGTIAIETKINPPNSTDDHHHHHPTEPEAVTDEADLSELTTLWSTSTETSLSDIKVIDQKYSQNSSGEYKHEVLFSNGNWRAEHGEYEDHNGVIVFVIRGVFSYYTREGTYNTTLYIVDEFGYHNVEPPITLVGGGLIDYRPDVETTSDCNNDKGGSYCIDPKLLALLVG